MSAYQLKLSKETHSFTIYVDVTNRSEIINGKLNRRDFALLSEVLITALCYPPKRYCNYLNQPKNAKAPHLLFYRRFLFHLDSSRISSAEQRIQQPDIYQRR